MKKIVIFIIACCCLLTGCSPQRPKEDISANSGNNEDLEHILIEHTCQYAVEDFCMPSFSFAEDVTYISSFEKEAWRDPLLNFLSSHTEDNDGVALFDLNFDGAPEVGLWHDDGGTALNSTVAFYDLLSGEPCGRIHTGWYGGVVVENIEGIMVHSLAEGGTIYGAWEVYLDENNIPVVFGKYNYGNMFNQTEYHFSEMLFDNESRIWYYNDDAYYWFHHYDRIYRKNEEVQAYITVDIDTGWHFKRDYKTTVLVDEVNAYFNELAETYRVVKDSQMIIFAWDDVKGSSHTERIESIADKLLSSKQRFLKVNGND